MHERLPQRRGFLDTLARFRAATDRRQRQREAGDLLTALLMAHGDPLLGPSGLVLMGQAYQEMGMHEEMVRVYEKALPKLRGPLASELSWLWHAGRRLLDPRPRAMPPSRCIVKRHRRRRGQAGQDAGCAWPKSRCPRKNRKIV